jgi:CCR4-NOT transcription complex subunit 6
VHTLLKGLEKIANSAQIPMVVAGDLNSTPGSAPHSLMLERRVSSSHRDLNNDPLHLFTGSANSNKLSHTLSLMSAYSAALSTLQTSPELQKLVSCLNPVHREPKYTNVTHDFKETLDYIVCSCPDLQPTALLELPDMEELGGSNTGLPNARWPSDHIALMAEFQFDYGLDRRPSPDRP